MNEHKPTTVAGSAASEPAAEGPRQDFQSALMEKIRAAGGTKAVDTKSLFQDLVRQTFQAFLDLEMEEHLGYPKNQPGRADGRGSNNTRNGHGRKNIRGDFGEIEIETPRDRSSTFEPKIVAKRQSSVGNFTDKVASLYARGMSTREIEEHIREMYGVEISPQFVSRATEHFRDAAIEWQNRPLEPVYAIVYIDGMFVSVRTEKGIVKKCVYTVLGVQLDGCQQVLGLWIEPSEGARFWLKVLNDLKSRGLRDILILCGDGLTGLPEAVESVYPKADLQLCVVHHIRNVTKFVAWKDRKIFCSDMRAIYSAPTIEAAELALRRLDQTWGSRYPMSIDAWRRNWDRLTAFFKYPVELRKIIYTTNAIESLHSQMRKNIASRKVFPHDDAVIKILYLNIRNFSNRWSKRHGWDIVMNQLAQMFPERLTPEVLDNL